MLGLEHGEYPNISLNCIHYLEEGYKYMNICYNIFMISDFNISMVQHRLRRPTNRFNVLHHMFTNGNLPTQSDIDQLF